LVVLMFTAGVVSTSFFKVELYPDRKNRKTIISIALNKIRNEIGQIA